MPLTVAPHPCPICGVMHTRPWPACEDPACRHAWRNRSCAQSKRRRYEHYVAQGKCGDCGTTIASTEKSRSTGTRPVARCAACRALQREQKKGTLAKARERAQEQAAAERVAATAARRRQANLERVAAGLPPSRSTRPTPPPPTIKRVDL